MGDMRVDDETCAPLYVPHMLHVLSVTLLLRHTWASCHVVAHISVVCLVAIAWALHPPGAQLVSSCVSLLLGGHDRTRLPATQLLAALSRDPALVPRLQPALGALAGLLSSTGGPSWAGARHVAEAAATALAALLAPSDYEPAQAQQVWWCCLGVTPPPPPILHVLLSSWQVSPFAPHAWA